MAYGNAYRYLYTGDVDAAALALAKAMSDAEFEGGLTGITNGGGVLPAVQTIGQGGQYDANNIGTAYLTGFMDAIMCSVGHQGFDTQSMPNVSITAGSWHAYGPTFAFFAPIAKRYVVSMHVNAQNNGASTTACYFRIQVTANSVTTTYDMFPEFVQAAASAHASFHGEVEVPMAVGTNTIQVQAQSDVSSTWAFNSTNHQRTFFVRG